VVKVDGGDITSADNTVLYGISTAYGIPIRLTRPSSSKIARIGLVFATYPKPSAMCAKAEPCRT
jgi:hypothetical protein